LFDGVEELDAVGPWEVLAYWTLHRPEDRWTVSCLSLNGADVTGAKNLVPGAHHSLADAPALDVLIHPGGIITSAGVSAGIDMALHLVSRLGTERAATRWG
jgi:transcriptional regulator GlxA family with amidase domain